MSFISGANPGVSAWRTSRTPISRPASKPEPKHLAEQAHDTQAIRFGWSKKPKNSLWKHIAFNVPGFLMVVLFCRDEYERALQTADWEELRIERKLKHWPEETDCAGKNRYIQRQRYPNALLQNQRVDAIAAREEKRQKEVQCDPDSPGKPALISHPEPYGFPRH